MLILKSLSALALLGSIAWLLAQPDYEPAIAVVTSLAALIGTFVVDRRKQNQTTQDQRVGKKGFGIQAGGDVKITSDSTSKK